MSEYSVRVLNVEELPKLGALGEQFTKESRYVRVDMDVFNKSWNGFLTSGVGVVFIAETTTGEVAGAIGALKFNEPNCGALMANEMFWIVSPEHRGSCGIRLLNRLEKWAVEQGCQWLWMNYLVDSMPEKVKGIYEKKGFTMAETHWVKEIAR